MRKLPRLPALTALRAFEAAARLGSVTAAAAGARRHPGRDQPPDPPAGGGPAAAVVPPPASRDRADRRGPEAVRLADRRLRPDRLRGRRSQAAAGRGLGQGGPDLRHPLAAAAPGRVPARPPLHQARGLDRLARGRSRQGGLRLRHHRLRPAPDEAALHLGGTDAGSDPAGLHARICAQDARAPYRRGFRQAHPAASDAGPLRLAALDGRLGRWPLRRRPAARPSTPSISRFARPNPALGVAIAELSLLADQIQLGQLITPVPVAVPAGLSNWFVCRPNIAERPAVRVFRDWLLAEAAKTKEWSAAWLARNRRRTGPRAHRRQRQQSLRRKRHATPPPPCPRARQAGRRMARRAARCATRCRR